MQNVNPRFGIALSVSIKNRVEQVASLRYCAAQC
jgi:hypothetical protein